MPAKVKDQTGDVHIVFEERGCKESSEMESESGRYCWQSGSNPVLIWFYPSFTRIKPDQYWSDERLMTINTCERKKRDIHISHIFGSSFLQYIFLTPLCFVL